MSDVLFTPSTQPLLDCILENIPYRRIDNIYKSLISGGVILNDELVTNVNANIWYLNLTMLFYNNEGANRVLSYRNNTPAVIYAMVTLPTATSNFFINNIFFNSIAFSGAMVNAVSTLTFNGYRVIF